MAMAPLKKTAKPITAKGTAIEQGPDPSIWTEVAKSGTGLLSGSEVDFGV